MAHAIIHKRRRNPIKALGAWLRRVSTPPRPPPGYLPARVASLAAVARQQRLEADVQHSQVALAESEQGARELIEEVAAATALEQGCRTSAEARNQLEIDLASAREKHDAASLELRAHAEAQSTREASWVEERAQLRAEAAAAARRASAAEERASAAANDAKRRLSAEAPSAASMPLNSARTSH